MRGPDAAMPQSCADEFDGHVAAKGGSGPGVAERVGGYGAGNAQAKGKTGDTGVEAAKA